MAADVVIVGAGLSGLMAGRTLSERGYSVLLVDSGRAVGGRLSTRRVGERGLADLGAQFFTVRSAAFHDYVNRWLEDGLVYIWGRGWSDGSTKRSPRDGYPRYAARGGMQALAQRLASGLPIRLDRRATSLQPGGSGWRLHASEGEAFACRGLILTPPVPESLKLLTASAVQLQEQDFASLRRIRFGPCLCGIHSIDGAVDLPEPGALQNFLSNIYWVGDNQAKGISQSTILTSHANAKFSRQNWDASEADIIAALESAVRPYLREGARITQTLLKKWRYSVPLTTHPQACMQAQALPPLIFAGDAFGGRGRVEGAFLSGLAAGETMAKALAG